MRCIITDSGLVFQADSNGDFDRLADFVRKESISHDLNRELLSGIIYAENSILSVIKKCHNAGIIFMC